MKKNVKFITAGSLVIIIGVASYWGISSYKNNKNYNNYLNIANSNIKSEKYDDAISAYKEASKYIPNSSLSAQIITAQMLKGSKEIYAQAINQMGNSKYLEAIETFNKVPKEDAKRYATIKNKIADCMAGYIKLNIDNANTSANEEDYIKALTYLDVIFKVDAKNQDAMDLKDKFNLAIKQNAEELNTWKIAQAELDKTQATELDKAQATELAKVSSLKDTVTITFTITDTKADAIYNLNVTAYQIVKPGETPKFFTCNGGNMKIQRDGAVNSETYNINMTYSYSATDNKYVTASVPLTITYKNATLNVWASEDPNVGVTVTKDDNGTPAD